LTGIYQKSQIVSIVIINYNGSSYISSLIKSLEQQSFQHFEIIFWDNNSSDNSLALISQFRNSNKIKIVRSQRNIGFAEASNASIAHCAGKYILFLNNDVTLYSNCLRQLVKSIKTCDIAAPLILLMNKYAILEIVNNIKIDNDLLKYLKNNFQHYILNRKAVTQNIKALKKGDVLKLPLKQNSYSSYKRSRNFLMAEFRKTHKFLLCSLNNPTLHVKDLLNSSGLEINKNNGKSIDRDIFNIYDKHETFDNPNAFSGCCFMIRKSIFLKHSFYDPKLFMYYEDVEFFWRLSKTNLKLKLNSKAIIRHDFNPQQTINKKYYIDRNRLLVLRKFNKLQFMRGLATYLIYSLKLFLLGHNHLIVAKKVISDVIMAK